MAKQASFGDSSYDAREYRVPAVLLAAGVLIYLIYAFLIAGMAGVVAMGMFLPVRLVMQVVLGLIACFITAKIMGANFGYLTTAIVKLAAIFIFPSAATFFIPWVGWVLALILYWKMLEWFFELDGLETIILALVIWGVNIGAIFLVAFLGFAMLR